MVTSVLFLAGRPLRLDGTIAAASAVLAVEATLVTGELCFGSGAS